MWKLFRRSSKNSDKQDRIRIFKNEESKASFIIPFNEKLTVKEFLNQQNQRDQSLFLMVLSILLINRQR